MNKQYKFSSACKNGHLPVVRELLGNFAVNVHSRAEYAFRVACAYGHLDVVRELLALKRSRFVNVHAGDEAAFRFACGNGRLDVVQALLALQEDRAVNPAAVKRCGKLYRDRMWERRRAMLTLRVAAVRARRADRAASKAFVSTVE